MITSDVVEAVVIWHGAKWREATSPSAPRTEPSLRVDPPKPPPPPRRVIQRRWTVIQPVLDVLVGWMTSREAAAAAGISNLQAKNALYRLKSLGLVQQRRDPSASQKRFTYRRVEKA